MESLGPENLHQIFRIKRSAIQLQRTFSPQRDVLNRLARDPYRVVKEGHRIYFRDVYDHVVRIHDISESLRDLIAGTLDTYLSVMSNRSNEIMKTLTMVTVMFMPMSFIVGFFGMNFFGEALELEARLPKWFLFFASLAVMSLSPVGMLAFAKRRRGGAASRPGVVRPPTAKVREWGRMSTRWKVKPFDRDQIAALSRGAGIPPLVAQVLINRGVTDPDRARVFLESRLTGLNDPETLPGAVDAADRVVRAIRADRPIVIYGDYDVDGVCGVSVLWAALRLAGSKRVAYYIPHRVQEGYGVNPEAIRRIAAEHPGALVVTVDCGISAVAEARLARELG
ncbi:hypothetical protein HK102_012519, partial [Quaeritorhiza haematococci]